MTGVISVTIMALLSISKTPAVLLCCVYDDTAVASKSLSARSSTRPKEVVLDEHMSLCA